MRVLFCSIPSGAYRPRNGDPRTHNQLYRRHEWLSHFQKGILRHRRGGDSHRPLQLSDELSIFKYVLRRIRDRVTNALGQNMSYGYDFNTGAVGYAYDADGNLITKTAPKPNQNSSSVTVSRYI
jgi:hypothetical protein